MLQPGIACGGTMNIADWLQALGLERYEAAFQENSVTVDLLPSLTPDDLKDLGITAVGHRRRLLDAIAALRPAADPAREPYSGVSSEVSTNDGRRLPRSAAERRQISVMFCDVVGFTALSSQLDPEDLSAVIRKYQATVSATIARFGGFIARYVGDGVLIYFGWPQAREADAERAVRAALAVISEIGEASTSERLRLRIGIATGLVVIGEPIGAGDARQQTAIGETPNLAARLQSLASDDGVVIDAATRRQIGRLFDCADLGFVTLKGISGPVQAWQVLKEAAVGSRFEALHGTVLAPLVGRDEELDLLMRRWAQVKAGSGRAVMISGEPGIGKSRLVAALEELLRAETYNRLRYFCSADYPDSPLHPIIQQLTFAAEFAQEDTHSIKWQKLRASLGTDTDTQDVALLGDLLALTSDELTPPTRSSGRQKERTFAALLRQLENLSRERPVLVLVEDVHWADPTTLELLDLALGSLPEIRVLLVATFRPDFQVPWSGHAGVTLITLSRLDLTEGVRLAGLLATELPPVLLNRIALRADGVPLFIEELAKDWMERAQDPESALQTLRVPTTLQGSLLARLDRLWDAKHVAQIGSVIGREFSYELISAVADLPESVFETGLKQLVSSGLIHCRGEPPSAYYRFRQALVQRAVYSTLLRNHRQQAHSRIADALSTRSDVEPQVLAHHLTEAGRVQEAVEHWLQAGQRLAARSAEREAINLFRRGLSALLTLPESQQRDRRELELQMALGMPLAAMEGYGTDVVNSVYERVHELGRGLGDTQSLLIGTYGTYAGSVARGDNKTAALISEQASAQFAREGDPICRLILRRMVGFAAFQAGKFLEAQQELQSVLELYDPVVHGPLAGRWGHDARAAALNDLTQIVWLLGYPDQAYRLMEDAFETARQISHSGSIGQVQYFAGVFFADLRRDLVALERHVDKTIAFDHEHGISRADVTFFQGISQFEQGMHADGLTLAEQGLALMPRSGGERRTYYLGRLAQVYAQIGDVDRAWQTIVEAQSVSERAAEHSWDALLGCIAGEILVAKGADSGDVEVLLQRAVQIARRQGAKSLELRAALSFARMLIDQGRSGQARDLLAPVYGWFSEGFETPDLSEARTLLVGLGV
jgi:class 3 adenylate cyclase/tetratricopeptide (TPR) repeat protein